MKTPLGAEVDLGPCHIVIYGVPAAAKGAQQPPLFRPRLICPRSPISATAELLYKRLPMKSSAVAEMDTVIGHSRHKPKIGGCAPYGGKLDPHVTLCGLVRGLPLYQLVASFDPFGRLGTINMGRKVGAVPLLGGARSPSNTVWPRPKPISIPGGIFIHPAVWPQQTWC